MSRWKVISLVLIIGLGVGGIVPALTGWWYDKGRTGLTLQSETAAADEALANVTYHFGLQQGVLSVIEGKPGVSGTVIATGLNVQAWPKEILDIAPKVEFHSLDEVQSFIDTVSEPLWQE